MMRQTSTQAQDLIHNHFRTITPVSMRSNTPGPIGSIPASMASAIASYDKSGNARVWLTCKNFKESNDY